MISVALLSAQLVADLANEYADELVRTGSKPERVAAARDHIASAERHLSKVRAREHRSACRRRGVRHLRMVG